ncbi:MAG: iron-containing alcohol dehydrogenase [Collinsella sp.]
MNDFSLYSPTRFVFGRKVTDKVGETLSVSGHRRALIVYGKGSVVRCGTLGHVKASLDAAGVEHIELRGVRPNPEIGLVREGVELARENDVDIILPVGGGSAMDCAKAIALGRYTTATYGTSSASAPFPPTASTSPAWRPSPHRVRGL